MDKNEEALILRAQEGNLHSFERLVHLHDEKVYGVLMSILGDAEDARDLYQDVFIKVYRSIHKFQFKSEFSTWLIRIAINAAITYRKKRSIKRSIFRSNIEGDEQLEAQTSSRTPEEELLNAELNEQIHIGISALPKQQKAVFVLRHYHGYKLNEIADIMECSNGTVKNYLFRATQKMRDALRLYHG